tara:strand:- start:21 stop:194 length:174 start_codon:yes stop_codon:yes gene_type:complete
VLLVKESYPTVVLFKPVVFASNALPPTAVLFEPDELAVKASYPTAVLDAPVVLVYQH